MDRDIDAQSERRLVDGSRERVVNDAQQAVLARYGRNRCQVQAAQKRVRRRFDINDLGVACSADLNASTLGTNSVSMQNAASSPATK